MLMPRRILDDETGAVAIITVVFVAIILTVLTTSFIRLTINEQREAIDNDLTTRAFYAAESGTQDAITAIANRATTPLANTNECTPQNGAGSGVLSDAVDGLDTEYTCQIINLSPTNFEAQLEKNGTAFFGLDDGGADGIRKLKIKWHNLDDGDYSSRRSAGALVLPPESNWVGGAGQFPAMIRLQLIAVPSTGPVNRSTIKNFVTFLNPSDGGGTDALVSVGLAAISDASCQDGSPSPTYFCEFTLTALDDGAFDYYVRVRALYRGTNISLEALNISDNAVALKNAQAVVDVTGRAADIYRRVVSRVDLNSDELWPDFTLLSAQEICKNFTITDVADNTIPPALPTDVDYTGANGVIDGSCVP